MEYKENKSFPGNSEGKESAYNVQESQVQSLGWENPLGKKWQPTPVFFPGEFHGQKRLVSYSLQDRKESDMTDRLTLNTKKIKSINENKLVTKHT